MNAVQWFYQFPLWVLYAGTILVVLLAFEGGFRLGKRHLANSKGNENPPVGSMVGTTLGLLAFILTFTFASASSHFDTRKQVAFDEANSIRAVYGLSKVIPEPTQEKVRALLRDYVDLRLQEVRTAEELRSFIDRSEKIQQQLWFEVVDYESKDPGRLPDAFYENLIEMINLHAKRITVALRWNISITIWTMLFATTVLGISSMGYHAGLRGARGSFSYLVLVFVFSIVIVLIADLDRPRQGLFKVNQQSLIDLKHKMDAGVF
jgi:hypothetical protein